jgi:hypothetical protein
MTRKNSTQNIFLLFFSEMNNIILSESENEHLYLRVNDFPKTIKKQSFDDILGKIKNKRYFLFHDFIKDFRNFISRLFSTSNVFNSFVYKKIFK